MNTLVQKIIHFLVLITALVVSSCAGNPVGSTPTNTSIPLPTGATQDAIATIVPPVTDWRGIPIMPGAYAGEGDVEGYVYVIEATLEQVRTYYEGELSQMGWVETPSEDAGILYFTRNGAAETVTINLIEKEGQVLVLLTK
ncbi:MAG: hypothetical protein FIB03_04695 [Anaerolineae bacterium]|nr:hypothetical protein [Anaerolineae bacterium]